MRPSKLKPVGTTIRFQFLLGDGTTALLGEGSVLQVRAPDDGNPKAPVGMLIKFTKLSQDSKVLVDRIVSEKGAGSGTLDDDFGGLEEAKEEDQDSKITKNDAFPDAAAGREYQPTPVRESLEESEAESESVDVQAASEETEPGEELAQDEESEQSEESEEEFELDLGEDWAGEDQEDQQAQETAEFDDPPTREAPEVADLPPTAEAATEEPLTAEAEEEEPQESGGPRKLAGTKGGLQVLAFDDMSDEELEEFQGFSFGEGDDEDEFDDMFDGLFGGSEAADDFLGGAFDGPGGQSEPSVPSQEIELPDEGEELDALLSEEANLDEPSSVEMEAAAAILGAEEDELEKDSDVEFELDDPVDEEHAVEEPAEQEPAEVESEQEFAAEELDEDEDDLDALIDFQRSPYEDATPEFGAQPEDEPEGEPEPETGELESLLGSFDDEDDESPELTLNLGAGPSEEKEEEPDDEESLEALLASAQKEIEEKQGAPEEDPEGDIIDQLLGDEDMPAPPSDAPTFSLPDGNKKKKKGFISKLFGKD